jgi:uncharacterized membrane protein YebE (DUF533 family)
MSEDNSKIKAMIERAMSDGVLSRAESEMIKSAIYADKKVSKEEAQLWSELQKMVAEGEIIIN